MPVQVKDKQADYREEEASRSKLMKYQIIYADPPWKSEDGWWNNKAWKASRFENIYPTMATDAICELPVESIADRNCHLYLWTTSRNLLKGDAWQVATAWGFRPINVLTWCKPQFGLGNYFRNNTEHLIFCVRGQKSTQNTERQGTHFESPRLRHSEKPAWIRDSIISWSGDVPRIELFAREKTDGWDAWGNEVECDIEL